MTASAQRAGWLVAAPLGLLAGLAAGVGGLLVLGRPKPTTAVEDANACVPARPCLAVVIDDVGRDLAALHELLALPADLTFAVLPHAAHTAASRRAIVARGRELLLHLPMDPLDRRHITDEPLVVGRELPPGPVTAACLARVPEAVGVNNHMGSAVTQDAAALAEVVEVIGDGGRFVLDSRTSDRSLFCRVARARGVPCLERDFFLDDPPVPAALTSAWDRALAAARRRGWAVVVGHPFASTVEAMRHVLGRREVRVVRLSRLLAHPAAHLTGQHAGI